MNIDREMALAALRRHGMTGEDAATSLDWWIRNPNSAGVARVQRILEVEGFLS